MKYFVSYLTKKKATLFKSGTLGLGNSVLETDRPMDLDCIREIEKEKKTLTKADECVLLNYIPMED